VRILRIFAVPLFIATGGGPTLADDTPSPEALQVATELFSILSADTMN
jgi:hypothetical protein